MLPLHRLAQSTSGAPPKLESLTTWVKSHPVWTSRVALRIAALLGAFLFALWWLAPPMFDRPPMPIHDAISPPSTGHPALRPELPLQVWDERATAVKDMFLYAYHGYEAAAFGFDELQPLANRSVQNFNGWGVSIVDSLSTMLLMDLKEEYQRGMVHVSSLKFSHHNDYIPFFETVIRYLGGLLSAYALSRDPVLLSLSDELGSTLLPIFNTTSGIPLYAFNPTTRESRTGFSGAALLAEIASCQMEYKYLAHLTGRPEYFHTVDRMMDLMEYSQRKDGMWSTFWSAKTGKQLNDHTSVGALADSGYEYLLKQYLLTGRSEKRLRDMYLKSVTGVLENLVYVSPNRKLLYVTDATQNRPTHKLEHLSCFYPGLLALGVETLSSEMSAHDAELHRWAAEGLATTCALQYAEQASGLGPEETDFTSYTRLGGSPKKWMKEVRKWERNGRKGGVPPGVKGDSPKGGPGVNKDYHHKNPTYLLRPETIESIYIMWRVTGDVEWRHRGWDIFQAIEKHTKTPYGYASVNAIHSPSPTKLNSMPSYFLAETTKYLYLLFSNDDPLPFDKWIFNTEAHPLPVFHWTDEEKISYKIPI